jgi:quercetin dioxygenase-like cupin family protein
MAIESEETASEVLLLLLSATLLFVGCASAPRLYLQYGKDFKQADLDTILAENPLGPDENIKVTNLGQAQGVSHHVVQVRDREVPHIHKLHDATVVMMRGQGYVMLDKRRVELSPGDTVFIARGAPHYFVNTYGDPSIALVIFSPPFDGKDTIPIP